MDNVVYISNTREDIKPWEYVKNQFDFNDMLLYSSEGYVHSAYYLSNEIGRYMWSYAHGMSVFATS